ncbi:Centrosomal protein of 63 kDa [Manis javanica]|nr:Centrosomal protein of 63 kDa [Manis javanica]
MLQNSRSGERSDAPGRVGPGTGPGPPAFGGGDLVAGCVRVSITYSSSVSGSWAARPHHCCGGPPRPCSESVSATCKQLSQELMEKYVELKKMEVHNNEYRAEIQKLKEQIFRLNKVTVLY